MLVMLPGDARQQSASKTICYNMVCAKFGEVAERPKARDCKSLGGSLRWFESTPPHQKSGSSSVGRASAFQAEGRGFESRLPLQVSPGSSVGRAFPW